MTGGETSRRVHRARQGISIGGDTGRGKPSWTRAKVIQFCRSCRVAFFRRFRQIGGVEGGKKSHVVVLGAGFGGLTFCKHFHHPAARITLVDRTNHHLFQPLLYQVATCALSATDVAQPIRAILSDRSDITVLLDQATGFDLAQKKSSSKRPRSTTITSCSRSAATPATSATTNGNNSRPASRRSTTHC